jgi:hypothetical protein
MLASLIRQGSRIPSQRMSDKPVAAAQRKLVSGVDHRDAYDDRQTVGQRDGRSREERSSKRKDDLPHLDSFYGRLRPVNGRVERVGPRSH